MKLRDHVLSTIIRIDRTVKAEDLEIDSACLKTGFANQLLFLK